VGQREKQGRKQMGILCPTSTDGGRDKGEAWDKWEFVES